VNILSLESNEMIKKRTRPRACARDPSAGTSDSAPAQSEENPTQDDKNGDILYVCVPPSKYYSVSDLLELSKFRQAQQGIVVRIEASKLTKGDEQVSDESGSKYGFPIAQYLKQEHFK
jgi:hypothetical protein